MGARNPALTLCPYRFSTRPEAMVAFLETLGLARRVTTDGDFFGVLAAWEGQLAVHGLSPDRPADTGAEDGQTQLVFLTQDAEAEAARFESLGHRAIWWDESYGRHAGVTGPYGEGIWLNEDGDHYGYRTHDATRPDPRLRVVAVRTCPDPAQDVGFFSAFGYTPEDPSQAEITAWGSEVGWLPLGSGEPGVGVLGLHAPDVGMPAPNAPLPEGTHNPVGDNAVVGLGFDTSEDLDALGERLRAAGYPVSGGTQMGQLRVTDPDGRQVEVHARSQG